MTRHTAAAAAFIHSFAILNSILDGCAASQGKLDNPDGRAYNHMESDNSADSTRYRRGRVNRVNSSDSQCYFDQQQHDHGGHSRSSSRNASRIKESKRARSRSTDHLPNASSSVAPASAAGPSELNSLSIRKMLRPVHTAPDSPVTSPENTRGGPGNGKMGKKGQILIRSRMEKSNSSGGCMSEPEFYEPTTSRPPKARSERNIMANGYTNQVLSPTSDDVDIFDSHCFATTPSSSNENSDADEPASPTSQLLIEYEEHLRNTLEKDSESFSLHTFEALLSRSMENLGKTCPFSA